MSEILLCEDCGQATRYCVYLYPAEVSLSRRTRRPFCWECAGARFRLTAKMARAVSGAR